MKIEDIDSILQNNNHFIDGLTLFLESDLSALLFDENDDLNTLYKVFLEAKKNEGLLISIAHNDKVKLLDILRMSPIKEDMQEVISNTFVETNPYTGLKDTQINAFYSVYVPLIFFCKVIPPQLEDNKLYFNAEGSITIAEVLDSINAIFYEYNSFKNRKTTLDGVSIETDFFNAGYNLLLDSYTNPFYNLYSRYELLRPITRVELAYILVCCLSIYKQLFGGLVCEDYTLGNSFNWLQAEEIQSNYEDGFSYELELKYDESSFSIDLKDYKGSKFLTDFLEEIKRGTSKLPIPLYMSLLEIGEQDLFYFQDFKLEPLNEVTRGELCYTLIKLCNYIIEKGMEV